MSVLYDTSVEGNGLWLIDVKRRTKKEQPIVWKSWLTVVTLFEVSVVLMRYTVLES